MALRTCLLAATAFLTLAACGQPAPTGPAVPRTQLAGSDECVPIAEGLYEFRDGRFLAVSAPQGAFGENPAIWKQEIETGLAGAGLSWPRIAIREKVAVVTGAAASEQDRDYGFKAARAAIEGHPHAGMAGLLILDGTTVEGGAPAPAEAVAVLAGQPITAPTCEAAFRDVQQGQTIHFETGNARISPVSTGLLDTLSGAALLCSAFAIEIGNHTDSRGADDYNRRLSQQRADALRAYMVSKGVPEESLKAVGYGESQLIDPANTAEAHAVNRRTEFKVTAR
ncbi:MAG: OmpA family protein [Hyphomonas sp.]